MKYIETMIFKKQLVLLNQDKERVKRKKNDDDLNLRNTYLYI